MKHDQILAKNSKGFSLVEVLVGVVIISLLFVGGYTSYREFVRRQVLENTRKDLKTNLGLARQKALSGEKPEGCEDILVGYEVSFTETSYTVSPECDDISPGQGSPSVVRVDLPSSVTIAIVGFTSPVLFKPIASTNLTVNGTINVTHAVTGTVQSVVIKPNGTVE